MKNKLAFMVLFATLGCRRKDSGEVYVCDSCNARRYHVRADCRGLSDCDFRIVKVSLADAKASGKTLCYWEK